MSDLDNTKIGRSSAAVGKREGRGLAIGEGQWLVLYALALYKIVVLSL